MKYQEEVSHVSEIQSNLYTTFNLYLLNFPQKVK